MQSNLEYFKTGWYGLALGLNSEEIDQLISALQQLKASGKHFHCRSDFEGEGGVGDIEFYLQKNDEPGNLKIESSIKKVNE